MKCVDYCQISYMILLKKQNGRIEVAVSYFFSLIEVTAVLVNLFLCFIGSKKTNFFCRSFLAMSDPA